MKSDMSTVYIFSSSGVFIGGAFFYFGFFVGYFVFGNMRTLYPSISTSLYLYTMLVGEDLVCAWESRTSF
jgi:hypothetical protein